MTVEWMLTLLTLVGYISSSLNSTWTQAVYYYRHITQLVINGKKWGKMKRVQLKTNKHTTWTQTSAPWHTRLELPLINTTTSFHQCIVNDDCDRQTLLLNYNLLTATTRRLLQQIALIHYNATADILATCKKTCNVINNCEISSPMPQHTADMHSGHCRTV